MQQFMKPESKFTQLLKQKNCYFHENNYIWRRSFKNKVPNFLILCAEGYNLT